MIIYTSLIILYSVFVALSVYFLGALRLFVDNINVKNLQAIFLNFSFWFGIFFALLARLTFVIINSQLSKLQITKNANTTITFIITLSSVIAVVTLNYFFLKDRLTTTQIIGSVVILVGILLMFK
jgi:drug/metabolite transporter (DMT)-like permease